MALNVTTLHAFNSAQCSPKLRNIKISIVRSVTSATFVDNNIEEITEKVLTLTDLHIHEFISYF